MSGCLNTILGIGCAPCYFLHQTSGIGGDPATRRSSIDASVNSALTKLHGQLDAALT